MRYAYTLVAIALLIPGFRRVLLGQSPPARGGWSPPSYQVNPFAGNTRQSPPQRAAWLPEFGLNNNENELFPSVVLALSGKQWTVPPGSNYIGDPLGMATIKILCTRPDEAVKVTVQVDGLSRPSVLEANLPLVGQYYEISPTDRWDFRKLATIYESYPATVTYSVMAAGENQGHKTITIRVRSVNDVPYLLLSSTDKPESLASLFAAYVDENSPYVESILQEALHYHAVNAFTGYQAAPAQVNMQVFAVWNVLQRRHIHYSNVSTPSAASPNGRVFSQTVRFIDQSISDQQANCVDGTVLFASVLYKIGIDPLLVIIPGHMFLGYYLNAAHTQLQFLETTLIGAGPQPGRLNWGFSFIHPVLSTLSYRQFVQALQYGDAEFNQEVRPNIILRKPGYMVVDIAKARQAGIFPIPR